MQPLAITRRLMTWLSMCLADESSNERQKKAYVAYTLAVLFFNLIGIIASLVFCLKFVFIDFDGATFAFMAAIVQFGLTYFMVAAIQMRFQIESIFTSLSAIYKSNENEMAFRHLARANNTSEWMWTIYMKYIKVSLSGFVITSLLTVLYCYLTRGDLNAKYFYRPTKLSYVIRSPFNLTTFSDLMSYVCFSLPWNQTTTIGYFGEMSATITMGYGYLILNGTPLLLFISLCMHHQAFYKMFKEKIEKIKICDVQLLCDLMCFHISAKDLFLDSANIYSSFVLVQLICSTFIMTVSVFYFDLQWHHFDFIVASVTAATSVGISTLFLYCYFGKLATESYDLMSDRIYNDIKWYEQPIELRKYFILMIQNMQKPIYYHGFYVANLDLRTFIKLCNSIFSYYMVIKTLAAK